MMLRWYGERAERAARSGAVAGLEFAAEHLLESANRTVPIEEGILQDSGQTLVDESEPASFVSYDTPYAVRQHEDRSLGHDAGRRAKWLELALNEEQATLRRLIGRGIEDRLR